MVRDQLREIRGLLEGGIEVRRDGDGGGGVEVRLKETWIEKACERRS